MNIKKAVAILLGKAILRLTKILKIGGGSAAPGYYALKIYPDLVSDLAQQIPKTIIITGTNGKTTTARMLSQIAQASGFKVLRNSTGSNLERGIASTLISQTKLANLAIWELDEAAFNTVVPKIKPDVIVFLNVFRDQLDRYGEVDSVIKKWQQTIKQVDKNTLIILNGDDHNLVALQKYFPGKVQTFGVKDKKIQGERVVTHPQLQKLDFEAKNIQPRRFDKIDFTLNSQNFSLPVPGVYHVYNFLAAFACAQYLEIPVSIIKKSLEDFSPAFGRVEKITLNTPDVQVNKNTHRVCEAYIFLIKNPVGATQVFQTLTQEIKPEDRLLLALNDNLADGTDVSWIWDAEFENLLPLSSRSANWRRSDLKKEIASSPASPDTRNDIIVSGTRAEDLALRLKYAGFDLKSISIESNLANAFEGARKGLKGRLFILPTYTALLELQKILAQSGLKKHYWEENEIKN